MIMVAFPLMGLQPGGELKSGFDIDPQQKAAKQGQGQGLEMEFQAIDWDNKKPSAE